MVRLLCTLLVLCVCFVLPTWSEDGQSKQVYEIRSYLLGENGDPEAIDQYLSDALVPALNRHGVEKVGVFTNAESDESGSPRIVVMIPYDSANQMHTLQKKIHTDESYLKDAKAYLDRANKNAPHGRVSSELLEAMDCMPKFEAHLADNAKRVYELRVYESANERLGNLKVHMFNNGEVPIFLDCEIQPVFLGQAIVGPQTPNLTYLTVYKDEATRLKAWDAFRAHPDWQVLKGVTKYKGTVSKIDKFVLVPKSYSQL